jgi:hypothetical protein
VSVGSWEKCPLREVYWRVHTRMGGVRRALSDWLRETLAGRDSALPTQTLLSTDTSPTSPNSHSPHSSGVTLALWRFISDRRSFPRRSARFSDSGRGEFRRRSFSRAARLAARSAACLSSRISINRRSAIWRLMNCDRESRAVTRIPEGRCHSIAAVSSLFTFWPPGPPERANTCSNSSGRKRSRKILCNSTGSRITTDKSMRSQRGVETVRR